VWARLDSEVIYILARRDAWRQCTSSLMLCLQLHMLITSQPPTECCGLPLTCKTLYNECIRIRPFSSPVPLFKAATHCSAGSSVSSTPMLTSIRSSTPTTPSDFLNTRTLHPQYFENRLFYGHIQYIEIGAYRYKSATYISHYDKIISHRLDFINKSANHLRDVSSMLRKSLGGAEDSVTGSGF